MSEHSNRSSSLGTPLYIGGFSALTCQSQQLRARKSIESWPPLYLYGHRVRLFDSSDVANCSLRSGIYSFRVILKWTSSFDLVRSAKFSLADNCRVIVHPLTNKGLAVLLKVMGHGRLQHLGRDCLGPHPRTPHNIHRKRARCESLPPSPQTYQVTRTDPFLRSRAGLTSSSRKQCNVRVEAWIRVIVDGPERIETKSRCAFCIGGEARAGLEF